jgi:hypothetical protein
MPPSVTRVSCGFGLGLAVGLLLSVATQLTVPSEWLRVTNDTGFEHRMTVADVQVEIARREVAEKTVEVLQHIAISHGGRSRCAGPDDRGVPGDASAASTAAAAAPGAAPALGEKQRANGAAGLKIYVYTLPADFNTNMLDSRLPRKFDCRASM